MSSGTKSNHAGARAVAGEMADRMLKDRNRDSIEAGQRVARLGLTDRQRDLGRKWSFYATLQYEDRETDWDGGRHAGELDRDAIVRSGYIPPGFYDARGSTMPLKFRRPSAPYHLVKVIVDRFTGLLFSERRHPELRAEGDPDGEDFIRALVDASRLWQQMIQARTFGGAQGTFCVGFQFLDGKPVVEVHDPRWIYPTFADRSRTKLEQIEKIHQYESDYFDQIERVWTTTQVWYRRIITTDTDTVFKPAFVGDGSDPNWEVETVVKHGLGFCPVVWGHNIPVVDEIDGEADAQGIYEMVEEIDRLLSQATFGILANLDPTLVLEGVGELQMSSIQKGSDNAIKLPTGSAKYLELAGTGSKTALEAVELLRRYALEVAQCVLDAPDKSAATATEIERRYTSMLAKADIMREQYGQRCILPLIEMMVAAARKVSAPTINQETGEIERHQLDLPARFERTGETMRRVERKLSSTITSTSIKLQWPGYFESSLGDAQTAVQAATSARAASLVDDTAAVGLIAPFFRVEDVPGMIDRLRAEVMLRARELDGQMMAGLRDISGTRDVGDDGARGLSPTHFGDVDDSIRETTPRQATPVQREVKFYKYEIDGGIVTLNEVRATKGLGPIADGELTMPQYRAKYAGLFDAAGQSGGGGPDGEED